MVFSWAGLISCGIETVPYLEPPSSSGIKNPLEGEQFFKFENFTENNINYFEGYEIYYKFYSADPEDTRLEVETNVIDNLPTRERLVSYNYRRLYSIENSFSLPLIPVATEAKKTAFSITLDFSVLDINLGFPEITYLDQSLSGSRYVKKSGEEDMNFIPFYLPYFDDDYEDFSTSLYTANEPYVYLVTYVMAYGKYDLINEIFSKPVSLGQIRLTVN